MEQFVPPVCELPTAASSFRLYLTWIINQDERIPEIAPPTGSPKNRSLSKPVPAQNDVQCLLFYLFTFFFNCLCVFCFFWNSVWIGFIVIVKLKAFETWYLIWSILC